MNCYFRGSRVINLNVKHADVQYYGYRLPIKDNAVDVTLSSDTIEHIPKDARAGFFKELVRVSKKKVVLCAPFGTQEHSEHEIKALKSGTLDPESLRYLQEHVDHGLPVLGEIQSWAESYTYSIYYQGEFNKVNGRVAGNRLMSYCFALWQMARNIVIDSFWKESKYLKSDFEWNTNRFFLVVDKNSYKENPFPN
jgi:hypothetical protein